MLVTLLDACELYKRSIRHNEVTQVQAVSNALAQRIFLHGAFSTMLQ